MLTEDATKGEIFAKQCFTNCLFERNVATCQELVKSRPAMAWALPLLLIYDQVSSVLAGRLPPAGQPLLHRLHQLFQERQVCLQSEEDLAAVQQFVRTTTPSERERLGLVGVSGHLAVAYVSRPRPQACLAALARALAVLQADQRNILLVKALFPKGRYICTFYLLPCEN